MSQTAQIIQFPDPPSGEQETTQTIPVVASMKNGYTQTPNEIKEKLCRFEGSGRQAQILNAVDRFTCGYHRKTKRLTDTFIAEITGYKSDPHNIGKDLRSLIARKVLVKINGEIGFNYTVSEWVLRKACVKISSNKNLDIKPIKGLKTTPSGVENTPKEGQKQPPYKETLKETFKENNNLVSTDVVTTLKKSTPDYSDEFIWLWENRPRRQGSDSKKKAFQCCKARLKQGSTWREMAEGMKRYKKYCQATGKLNTEFTMQMTRFFGSEEQFKEDWGYEATTTNQSVFTNQPAKLSTVDRQHAAAAEYLARLNSEQSNKNEDGGVVAAYE